MRTGRFSSSEGLRVPAGAPPRSLLSDLRQTPQNQDPETEGPGGTGWPSGSFRSGLPPGWCFPGWRARPRPPRAHAQLRPGVRKEPDVTARPGWREARAWPWPRPMAPTCRGGRSQGRVCGGTVNLGRRCERDRWERGRVARELSMPRGGPARELPHRASRQARGAKQLAPLPHPALRPSSQGSPSHCLLAPWQRQRSRCPGPADVSPPRLHPARPEAHSKLP